MVNYNIKFGFFIFTSKRKLKIYVALLFKLLFLKFDLEYSENKQNGNIERIKNRKRNLLNKSISKQSEIVLPQIASSSSSKSIVTLPSISKK